MLNLNYACLEKQEVALRCGNWKNVMTLLEQLCQDDRIQIPPCIRSYMTLLSNGEEESDLYLLCNTNTDEKVKLQKKEEVKQDILVMTLEDILIEKPVLETLLDVMIGEIFSPAKKGMPVSKSLLCRLDLDGYIRIVESRKQDAFIGFKKIYQYISALPKFEKNSNWIYTYLQISPGECFKIKGSKYQQCYIADMLAPYKIRRREPSFPYIIDEELMILLSYPTQLIKIGDR